MARLLNFLPIAFGELLVVATASLAWLPTFFSREQAYESPARISWPRRSGTDVGAGMYEFFRE
jgi:hypothetical protein